MNKLDESIELTVVNGEINRSGIARVKTSIFDQLDLDDENQKITITYNDKSIIRKAFADEFVDEQAIFLREDAREELNVNEGDKVSISAYKTIEEKAEEGYSDTKQKIKEKVKTDEEE